MRDEELVRHIDPKAVLQELESTDRGSRTLDAHVILAVEGHDIHAESDPETGIFAFWEGQFCTNCSGWPELTTDLGVIVRSVPSETRSLVVTRVGERWYWEITVKDRRFHGFGATRELALAACLLRFSMGWEC